VFISHRISALKWVDHIVVLNRGVIEEQGKHDQLIRRRGLYAYLYNIPPGVFMGQQAFLEERIPE